MSRPFLKMTLAEIADLVGGEIRGDGKQEIRGVASFSEASEHEISFAADAKYLNRMEDSKAGAMIVPMTCSPSSKNLILVDNPRVSFAKVMALFHPSSKPDGGISDQSSIGGAFFHGKDVHIGPYVSIGNNVTIGDRVTIHPGVVIEDDVRMGSDVVVKANVSILERCCIGSRVTIHPGTVVGSDGFGYALDEGTHYKIPQTGNVVIGDDVEIGANNAIDRATFGSTYIGNGVKTDNLVHIAHNVTIGDDSILLAQVAIAGSVKIGKHVILAGQSAIAPHLSIGDNVTVGPKSGITKSIPDNEVFIGTPGMPHKVWLKTRQIIPKLPDMRKKILMLEKRLNRFESDASDD